MPPQQPPAVATARPLLSGTTFGMFAIVVLIWLLSLVVVALPALGAALSRSGEYAADRHAVELGYGPGLVRVLELFVVAERSANRPRGLAALLRTHPTCEARILAVGRALTS